jgi:methanogen homocitrate synthase
VNAERRIVLGKKSGLDSVVLKAAELGLSVSEDQRASVLAKVKKCAIAKGGLLTDQEFRTIVAEATASPAAS